MTKNKPQPSTSKSIVLAESRTRLDTVRQQEEHKNLSPKSLRLVLKTMVSLEKVPSESETDKLMTIEGRQIDISLDTKIDKGFVEIIEPEHVPAQGSLRVSNLVEIYGTDAVFAAADYMRDYGSVTYKEGENMPEGLAILALSKAAFKYDLEDSEKIDDFIGKYCQETGSSRGEATLEIAQMSADQMEIVMRKSRGESHPD